MKNVAHSVRERLLNRARETGLPHEYLLVRYALERFLYRLSVSPHAGRFLLKGALLFSVWGRHDHRPTRDADLLDSGPGGIEQLEPAFRDICAVTCDDGIVFNPDSVRGKRIAEDKVYAGVRVVLEAELAKARIQVQVDVGFGDAVTPGPESAEYPSLLDFPAPKLRVYPVYTVVAEKLHAMVALALDNSRMKDFYDLWAIAQAFELDTGVLAKAIAATFERRWTEIPGGTPVALTPAFADSARRKRHWEGFVRRNRLPADRVTFEQTQAAIAGLVIPALKLARNAPQ